MDQSKKVMVNGVEEAPNKKVSLEKLGKRTSIGTMIDEALAQKAQRETRTRNGGANSG